MACPTPGEFEQWLTVIPILCQYSVRMRAKYYTRFLLRSAKENFADEYSGVVELNQAQNQVLDPAEIEALLAQNFDMDAEHVELLNWSRLH